MRTTAAFLLAAATLCGAPLAFAQDAPKPARTSEVLPSVADLVDRVKGSVVSLEVTARRTGIDPRLEERLERFFGRLPPGFEEEHFGPRIQRGSGSGVIIDASGRVLTNAHVVEDATSIRVTLVDGRELTARVVGRDPLTDLALLQIDAAPKDLTVARLGDSDAVRVGEPVLAIGNPFGLTSSVSLGILSGRAREIQAGPYDDFLQTDAAINPGNSGGPLFNGRGEVIGINTAIAGIGTGVGFAIPSNMAKRLLPALAKGGDIQRGWLGVSVQDLTPEIASALKVDVRKGALLSDVRPGTPAREAGLAAYDVVTSIEGRPVESARDLTRAVGFLPPGDEVTLHVIREGARRNVEVKLGVRPDLEQIRPVSGREGEEERGAAGGSIGLRLRNVPRELAEAIPGGGGALIAAVEPGSPADEAGLREGMVVLEANGKPVASAAALAGVLRSAKPGSTLLLRIQAGEGRAIVPIRIGGDER